MNQTVKAAFGLRLVLITIFFSTQAFPSTDTLTMVVASYFAQLKGDFNKFAASASIKNSRLPKLRSALADMLDKHSQIQSLLKADSKGVVVAEQPSREKREKKKRRITGTLWFSKTAQTLKEYTCLVKEKNGNVFLYWTVPIMRENSPRKRFNGAIVAKVDLRTCFHEIADQGFQPFVVRYNNKNIYEHLWKPKMIFIERALDFPGLEKLSVRYQKSGVSTLPQSETQKITDSIAQVALTPTSPPLDSQGLQKPDSLDSSASATKKNMPVIVSLIVFIIVILVLLIIQITDKINRNRGDQNGGKNGIS
jgi:hypothetical protein